MKTTSKTALIATLAITAAFTAGFASGPASAQGQVEPNPFKFQFRYDAAELGHLEGANNVIDRLQAAVKAHCGSEPIMSTDERVAVEKCVDRTMRDSIAKFGSPTVAQAFQSRADG